MEAMVLSTIAGKIEDEEEEEEEEVLPRVLEGCFEIQGSHWPHLPHWRNTNDSYDWLAGSEKEANTQG